MAANKNEAGSAEQQLEAAKKRIAELENALVSCQQECALERENNGSFLVAYLDDEFKAQATASDLKASQAKEPAVPTAAAHAWRSASDMLQKFAVNEFPAAQEILAAIDGTDKPPARSHLLLIAVLMKLLAECRGSSQGLQSDIIKQITDMRWSVLGLRKKNVELMLAAANKAASHHGLSTK